MNFNGILFDLDNTLIGIPETWNYFDSIIQEVISKKFHLPIPSQEQRDTLWRSGKEYINILKNWNISKPDLFWKYFDELDWIHRQKLIELRQLVLYNDVIPTLNQLRNIEEVKLGIVTNTPLFIAKEELKAYDLLNYFDHIVALGDDQSICKPEPTGIQNMLAHLGILPQNAIYIGDSSIDILASIAAQVTPVLIERNNFGTKKLPNLEKNQFYRIATLSEIFKIIE